MLYEVKEMPTEGQFVANWKYKGDPWSDTFKYDEAGSLLVYCDESDDFEYRESYYIQIVKVDVIYYVTDRRRRDRRDDSGRSDRRKNKND
jgi:hypothetical protein